MKNEDNYIQELFSQKLQHAEAPVDPAIWEGISNALPSAAAGGAAASSTGFQLGTLGWVATTVVAVAVTAASIFFISQGAEKEETTATVETVTPAEAPADESTVDQVDEAEVADSKEVTEKEKPSAQPASQPEASTKAEQEPLVIDETPKDSTHPKTKNNPDPVDPVDQKKDSPQDSPPPPAPKANPALTAAFEINEDTFEDLKYNFAPAFTEATSYRWQFGDGSTSEESNPAHTFHEEGTYVIQLTALDSNGFEQTIEKELNVVLPSLLVLPNTFTPDNNGTNDVLLPAVLARNVQILQMQVYSTKGELIFEQDENGLGWDGNLADGSPAPKGDYMLIVKAISPSGENITKQRKVLLQRN